MKKVVLLLMIFISLFWINNQTLSAQEEKVANNMFFSEIGGPGLIFSANIDGRFSSKSHLGFGYRVGAGFGLKRFEERTTTHGQSGIEYRDYTDVRRTVYSFPVGLNYIFGSPKSASSFEVGGGVSILSHKAAFFYFDDNKSGYVMGYLTFMYRLAPVNGGFSLRVGLSPIIGTGGDLCPMAALSMGYAF